MKLFRRDFEIDQYGVIDPKNGVNRTPNQTNQTNTEKAELTQKLTQKPTKLAQKRRN